MFGKMFNREPKPKAAAAEVTAPAENPMIEDALYQKEIKNLDSHQNYTIRVSYEGSRNLPSVTYRGNGGDIRRAIEEDIELGKKISAVEHVQ